jgi:uncharacterized integral membrane protein
MATPSPYKRRRPVLIRNLWVYRRLVGLAIVLGILLWFMVINNAEVSVVFPFRLGTFTSTIGIVILISVLTGSAFTAVLMTALRALRLYRDKAQSGETDLPDDRPPADYAAKTGEGFPDFH